jgi:hypothetical protein
MSEQPQLDDDGLIRLQKLLAQSGVASRRHPAGGPCQVGSLTGAVAS